MTNSCGTDNTSQSVTINCLNAVADALAQNVRIYPNPSSGLFTVDLTGVTGEELSILVFDVRGELVHSVSDRNFSQGYQHIVDLSDLASGAYFVKVSVDGETATRKVLKY